MRTVFLIFLSSFLAIMAACTNAPTVKQLIGVWNIDKLKIEYQTNGTTTYDTVFSNCGEMHVFRPEKHKGDDKDKIYGYFEEPICVLINGSRQWIWSTWWFNGSSRQWYGINKNIDISNFTATPGEVMEKSKNHFTMQVNSLDGTLLKTYTLTKK